MKTVRCDKKLSSNVIGNKIDDSLSPLNYKLFSQNQILDYVLMSSRKITKGRRIQRIVIVEDMQYRKSRPCLSQK